MINLYCLFYNRISTEFENRYHEVFFFAIRWVLVVNSSSRFFVVYDKKYQEGVDLLQQVFKGWRRSRIQFADSDFLDLNHRYLADTCDRVDLLTLLREAYWEAPEFCSLIPLLEEIIGNPSGNLFEYIVTSIRDVCGFFAIHTPLIVSSEIDCDHSLKLVEFVQNIGKTLGSDTYIEPAVGWSFTPRRPLRKMELNLNY